MKLITGWSVTVRLDLLKQIYIMLESDAATDSGSWNNTAPSSSVFYLGSNLEWF